MTSHINYDTIHQTLRKATINNKDALPYPRFMWDVIAVSLATNKVMNLHRPHAEITIDNHGHATARAVCQECSDPLDITELAPWPCQTFLTITGAIDQAYTGWEQRQSRDSETGNKETVKEEGE